jgi:hypothetical protein
LSADDVRAATEMAAQDANTALFIHAYDHAMIKLQQQEREQQQQQAAQAAQADAASVNLNSNTTSAAAAADVVSSEVVQLLCQSSGLTVTQA